MQAACARIALAAAIKSGFGYNRARPLSTHGREYRSAWLEFLKRFSPLEVVAILLYALPRQIRAQKIAGGTVGKSIRCSIQSPPLQAEVLRTHALQGA
jgi:hypothetical protein